MNEKSIQVPVSLLQNFVGFVEKSSALLERASEERALSKQAAPEVVDQLVKQGLLDESQRTVAQTALSGSHLKTLETLKKAASFARPAEMGKAAEDITKPKSVADEADAAFLRKLGF